MEKLWTAVCSNDLEMVEEYFSSGGPINQRYEKFGNMVSLIMGAVRNGHVDMVRLLRSYGETIEEYEEAEYKQRIEPLRREYYKPEIERLKGKPLHFEMVVESASSTNAAKGDERMGTAPEKYTARCREYPEFVYEGSFGLDDAYYALCEWLRR